MCINVLRPRSGPFKFGWVSISLCYAKIRFSVQPLLPRSPSSNVISSCSCRLCTVWWRRSLKSPHKVENASELQLTSISDQYLLYVFMYSWVYNGATAAAVLFRLYGRLHTDDRPDDDMIFVFHFIWGHVPGGWICYQYSSREGPLVISIKSSPNIKIGTS